MPPAPGTSRVGGTPVVRDRVVVCDAPELLKEITHDFMFVHQGTDLTGELRGDRTWLVSWRTHQFAHRREHVLLLVGEVRLEVVAKLDIEALNLRELRMPPPWTAMILSMSAPRRGSSSHR